MRCSGSASLRSRLRQTQDLACPFASRTMNHSWASFTSGSSTHHGGGKRRGRRHSPQSNERGVTCSVFSKRLSVSNCNYVLCEQSAVRQKMKVQTDATFAPATRLTQGCSAVWAVGSVSPSPATPAARLPAQRPIRIAFLFPPRTVIGSGQTSPQHVPNRAPLVPYSGPHNSPGEGECR
jgi:hypothetical protein